MSRIIDRTDSFIENYPQFREMANEQMKVMWFPDEIKLEKDLQDILVNITPAEKHGVITTLRLFTLYERIAGVEFWSGTMMKRYPVPEVQAMASVFSAFELGVHYPFYSKINELLDLHTDKFYLSYVDDPVLKERIEFIDSVVAGQGDSDIDKLVSTAGFTFIEGAVLYSSFAYLKHFQSETKNKMLNLVRGINFSAVDENLHSLGAAGCFKIHKEQLNLSEKEDQQVQDRIQAIAEKVLEHEKRIIEMIFMEGTVEGITATQLTHFVESRINLCLRNLGYNNLYKVSYNPISDWFYDGLNNFQFIDFFTGQGREYQRDWDETSFVWSGDNNEE